MSSLKVVPHGLIKGGHLNYSIPASGEVVNYDGSVDVKIGFWTKTYPFAGSYQAGQGQFTVANFKTVGANARDGEVYLEVLAVDLDQNLAHVGVKDSDISLNGVLDVSIAGPDDGIVTVVHAHATAQVHGFSVTIEAELP